MGLWIPPVPPPRRSLLHWGGCRTALLAGGRELEMQPNGNRRGGGQWLPRWPFPPQWPHEWHTDGVRRGSANPRRGARLPLDDCNDPEPRTIPRHSGSAGWLAAQKADGRFITAYAREYPNREDVAESIWGWFVVRCVPDRVPSWVVTAIKAGIPHRLAYFDSLDLDMSPYSCTNNAAIKAEFPPERLTPRGGEDE